MAATNNIHNNRRAVGSSVLCVVCAEAMKRGQMSLEKSLETTVRRVGGWCEMATRKEVSQSAGKMSQKWDRYQPVR
jgi:hypothetical protein